MNNRECNWYEGEYGGHRLGCGCVDCTKRRLEAARLVEAEEYYSGRIYCPVCNKLSVNWDGRAGRYVCSNPNCRASGESLYSMT